MPIGGVNKPIIRLRTITQPIEAVNMRSYTHEKRVTDTLVIDLKSIKNYRLR